MKILYMEDQDSKFEHVNEALQDNGIDLIWKKSCQTGLMELINDNYEYLLLDMSMPLCENEPSKENFDSYAGMMVLREIKRKNYNLKVIIITGFSDFEKGNKVITLNELIKEIELKYKNYYIGYVKYDSTSVEWQHKLKELLKLK